METLFSCSWKRNEYYEACFLVGNLSEHLHSLGILLLSDLPVLHQKDYMLPTFPADSLKLYFRLFEPKTSSEATIQAKHASQELRNRECPLSPAQRSF